MHQINSMSNASKCQCKLSVCIKFRHLLGVQVHSVTTCWLGTPWGITLEFGGPTSLSIMPRNCPDWDRVWDFLEAGGGGSCPTVGWFWTAGWWPLKQSSEFYRSITMWSALVKVESSTLSKSNHIYRRTGGREFRLYIDNDLSVNLIRFQSFTDL